MLNRIVAGVVAVQALVSAEAVRILGRMGVKAKDAAFFLESGSAGNDSLRGMVKALDSGKGSVTPTAILKDLEAIVGLADAADVPGAVFEVGRHMTLALLDRYGADVDLWKTAIDK